MAPLAALMGCNTATLLQDDAEDLASFLPSCEAAPDPQPPTQPITCDGPDQDGWSNDARPEDAGPCPDPPAGGCTQIVIGRLADTARYIDCPGYIVLNRSDWTIDLNDNFIACAAACEIGTCDPSIIVVSTREEIPDFNEDFTMTTVTSRELCQLNNSGCTVTMAGNAGPGSVECPCASEAP